MRARLLAAVGTLATAAVAALAIAAVVVLVLAVVDTEDPGEDRGVAPSSAPPPAAPPAPEPAATATVSVRLDQPLPTRGSMNGFIHALDAQSPATALVAPLRPRLWRSDLVRAPVDRARALGADYQFVLSDAWGYPKDGWRGRGPPWADLEAWERFVRATARRLRGEPISWDIWNEPDSPEFWTGGRERFLDTYAVANRVLREELGRAAVIGGPSTRRYAPEYLTAFLERCLAERCDVDFLSWHANLKPEDSLGVVGVAAAEARVRFVGDPRWAPLGLRAIHVNEYVGRSDRYLPAEAATYLGQLEGGGADRAARSCWTAEDCSPTGLDGLLADGEPRAVWWVHRWYADGVATRVASESTDPALAILPSAPAPGSAAVVIGYAGARPAPPEPEPDSVVALELAGLPADRPFALRVERVPAAGAAPVPAPEVLEETTLRSGADGVARMTLPALAVHEAMLVSVEPAAR